MLLFGEKFASWLIQLTKRDVAVLFFVFLAAIGQPAWILHLLFGVTAISLALALARLVVAAIWLERFVARGQDMPARITPPTGRRAIHR